MRPYTSGLNRGAPGLGASTTAQTARLERERAERERIQREQAAAAQAAAQTIAPPRMEDLSEEQREEVNEAVCTLVHDQMC